MICRKLTIVPLEVICRNNRINSILNIKPSSYQEALEMAFNKIESNTIVSSWKDSYSSSGISFNVSEFIVVVVPSTVSVPLTTTVVSLSPSPI